MGAGISYSGAQEASNSQPDVEALDLFFQARIPIESVIQIVEHAGSEILTIYNSEVDNWEVEVKDGKFFSSPLTKADLEGNTIICEGLQRISPHVPIISEENPVLSHDIRKNYEYVWMVDPLDGTKDFIKRNGEFTVNIALIHQGQPLLGVVHVPVTGQTYWAVKGKGAWRRQGPPGHRTQERIQVAKFKIGDKGLSIVGAIPDKGGLISEFTQMFESPEIAQVGSSLKLLMVAEGSAHMYPRLLPCCEWDTAAADIIVREAGGVVVKAGVCDGDGNALEDWKAALMKEECLEYNKENLLNPFFVAFGQRLPESEEY